MNDSFSNMFLFFEKNIFREIYGSSGAGRLSEGASVSHDDVALT